LWLFSYPLLIEAQALESKTDTLFLIYTPEGNITLRLYNDTPEHRDNFIKLVKAGFYDSTLFHRVIPAFMIQGGDPDSRNCPKGKELGNGGPGYDILPEITPAHFHRRGVLAAAREADKLNPQRLSSGSQFYIVQGKIQTEAELDRIEKENASLGKQQIFIELMKNPENIRLKNRFFSPDAKKDTASFHHLLDTLNLLIEQEYNRRPAFRFTEEQRRIYTTQGGTPHLDGKYTIFGEVVDGMSVVDAIADAETDENDRPLTDIPIKITLITHKKTEP
jgi:cyclophilin family peptidyl-prolyl cis-trans isomerase